MSADAQWIVFGRALFALIFVIGLIFLCAAMVKKYGFDKYFAGSKARARRLSVVETLYIDPKRRLVIVRRDNKEHLLLMGVSGDVLVESFEKDAADA